MKRRKRQNIDDFEFLTDEKSKNKSGVLNVAHNEFTDSLDALTQDDIAPMSVRKKDRKPILGKIFALAFTVVCLAVLAWGVYTIAMSVRGYAKGTELYDQLSEYFNTGKEPDIELQQPEKRSSPSGVKTPVSVSLTDIRAGGTADIPDINVPDTDVAELQYRAKLEYLKKINPDIYGWIKIDGTNVDYPIVRGEDNTYYLSHAYTGEYMIVGSIFADCRTNDKIINNYNTVLYGHNMENGTMFHAVEEIFNDEKLFDSARIVIYVPEGIYTYAPISVYETISTDRYFRMNFKNEKEFTDFADGILEKSVFPRRADFTVNDRILTLSTCTNEETVGRYALHARLVDFESASEDNG